MTTYFDRIRSDINTAQRVGAADETGASLWERLGLIEERLVTDCTIAVEFPDCPADIRDAVHRIILRDAVQCQPSNAPPENADFEFDNEYADRIRRMESDLHTLFHSLAWLGLDRFSDDPRTPLRCLYAQGEARREGMVGTKPPADDGSLWRSR